MTDLTHDDWKAIHKIVADAPTLTSGEGIVNVAENCYRAGLAAGRARAIEECAKVCDDLTTGAGKRGRLCYSQDCAAAIRALK